MTQTLLEKLMHSYAVNKIHLAQKTNEYNQFIGKKITTEGNRTQIAKIEMEYNNTQNKLSEITDKINFINSGDKYRLIDALINKEFILTQLSSISATLELGEIKIYFDLVSVKLNGTLYTYDGLHYEVPLEEILELINQLQDGDKYINDNITQNLEYESLFECFDESDPVCVKDLIIVGVIISVFLFIICAAWFPFTF